LVSFLSPIMVPVAHASTPGVSNISGPWALSWAFAVWSNRYPGATLQFEFGLADFDTTPPNDTLSTFQLTTPWGNYTDPALPAPLCGGCTYDYKVNVTVPVT
jgi:hypothetical protein